MNPSAFLKDFEPFSRLDAATLAHVEDALEITYAKEGEVLLRREGPQSGYLWIVRKGAVRLEIDGRTVDILGAGEAFGFPSLLSGSSPHFDVVVDEAGLFYRVGKDTFYKLMETPVFESFFRAGLADRLRHATAAEPTPLSGDLATPLAQLVAREPVTVPEDARVGDAARVMRDSRISSVIVESDPQGILTDRDLRTRVLAAGLGPDAPVAEVMSAPLKTLPADSSVSEAMVFLLRERIHHLAVERDGEVVGVVTHTDILRHHAKSPGHLLKRVEKARGAADIQGYADEVAAVVEALLWGGLDPLAIGQIVASLNDAVVAMLVRAAERELGAPPCHFAWLVFGSEGRREQALITDQDNALVYELETPENASYFERFASFVVEGLVEVGFPRCAGDFMATKWRHSLAEWESLFEKWTAEPDPQALMEVANFFDFRTIAGDLPRESLHARIEAGGQNQTFLAQLAKASLGMRPPIGLFHRIKSEEGAVDVKAGGLMPIIGLGRLYGIAAGTRERSTIARLKAAQREGLISEQDTESLEEGFRFLFKLRLAHQITAARRGESVTNRIVIDELSPLEGRHLKDTFLHVREMQQGLSRRYNVEMLG